MDESKLIRLLQKKDRKAQVYFYNKYAGAVYAFSNRYLSNNEDAEEITTDVFLKVFEKTTQFEWQGEGSFWAWVKKIAMNACLMKLRQKTVDYESVDAIDTLKDENMDALAHLSLQEIQQMIICLPIGYRTVFNLFVLEGIGHKEIAQVLNISEQTSKSQLFKAKKALKEMLKEK